MVAVIILYLIEQVLLVNYFIKTVVKIGLFVFIPVLFIKLINKASVSNQLKLRFDKHLKTGIILGLISFCIVIIAYMIFRNSIDFAGIVTEMQEKSRITAANFVLVGLYVTFINSFLEEFFFRGYIFLNLRQYGRQWIAYTYSSMLFALYHIAIFKTWFSLPLTLLALLGLVIIGIIFNYVDTKSENLLNSWIIHILADTAIIIIGFRLFNIL